MDLFQLASVLRGDTWPGIDQVVVTVNGMTPAIAAASARMQFRKAMHRAVLGDTLSTDDGSIEITSPTLWIFRVPPRLLAMSAGRWAWDFQVTDADGTVLTPFGGTLDIAQDVTQ